jgi:Tfp pilus assembly protein PilN
MLSYVRTQPINENDEKQIILKKLKDELKTKQVDIVLLKQDIKDLEIDLESVLTN